MSTFNVDLSRPTRLFNLKGLSALWVLTLQLPVSSLFRLGQDELHNLDTAPANTKFFNLTTSNSSLEPTTKLERGQ